MDLSSHVVLIVMAIAVAASLRGEIHMKPTNPGCGDPLHLGDCCRVTGLSETASRCARKGCISASSVAKASKDWSCRKQPACPNLFLQNGLQTIIPLSGSACGATHHGRENWPNTFAQTVFPLAFPFQSRGAP
jgi:hypothetical protein